MWVAFPLRNCLELVAGVLGKSVRWRFCPPYGKLMLGEGGRFRREQIRRSLPYGGQNLWAGQNTWHQNLREERWPKSPAWSDMAIKLKHQLTALGYSQPDCFHQPRESDHRPLCDHPMEPEQKQVIIRKLSSKNINYACKLDTGIDRGSLIIFLVWLLPNWTRDLSSRVAPSFDLQTRSSRSIRASMATWGAVLYLVLWKKGGMLDWAQ